MSLIAFVILTALAVISAIVVVWRTNPVVSALALAFNLVSIAGFYMLLGAQFIALLQVLVYAGAIMVLILFVIMLLNLPENVGHRSGFVQRWLGPALAFVFTILIGWTVLRSGGERTFPELTADFGTVGSVGETLFRQFFYAFEAISLLLIVAMVGAVLLAKKRI
jgi:NADH-quinone oxidoreductase subunit J